MALITGVVLLVGGFAFVQLLGTEKILSYLGFSAEQQTVKSNEAPLLRETIENDVTRIKEVDESAGTLQEIVPSGDITEPVLAPIPQPKPEIVRQEQSLVHLPDPELIERGATGVIPKRSKDGLRPLDVYSRRPETEGNFGVARVVIVVAGLGISQTSTQQAITELPGSVTLAFAPYGNSLGRWMQRARKSGHELLLQVPMEPLDEANIPGAHTLKANATRSENLTHLHWAMSRITNYVGIMNHLGGRMLAQTGGLKDVFAEIADRGLMFFEDGSVRNSIGEGMAVRTLLPYAKGNVLIDNVRSRAAIAEKLEKLASEAKRTGLAVGVANAFPDSISLIAQFVRKAKELGIEITPVSAIAKDPQR